MVTNGASIDRWRWWFELAPEAFAPPLATAPPEEHELFRLLLAPLGQEMAFSDLAERFAAQADRDSSAAALCGGLTAICQAGRDFSALPDWIAHADALMAASPPPGPLARASLLLHTVVAGIHGPLQLTALQERLARLTSLVDEADSDPLRMMSVACAAHIDVFSGSLHRAREAIADALHLCPSPGCARLPRVYLVASLGLICTLQGDTETARLHLDGLAAAREFDTLPSALWLICQSHRLLAHVLGRDAAGLDNLAEQIRSRAIPEHNAHLQSYLHYSLGVAALLAGKSSQALDHARRAEELGARCHCFAGQALPALVIAQALGDQGQTGDAVRHLERWLPAWQARGLVLLEAAGNLELAALLSRGGGVDAARAALRQARRLLPREEPLPAYHRAPGFGERLEEGLLPGSAAAPPVDPASPPLRIVTLGGLAVSVGGRTIFDRDWRGDRTKTLLKALIVLGGHKVSDESLCDLLWPDADGAQAHQNLKVTIWRLRRLGAGGTTPLPWVAVRQGQVSLVRALCGVDALEFEHHLHDALACGASLAQLTAALDRYSGDFLAGDDSEAWIVAHRERLRQRFFSATHTLGRRALATGETDLAKAYLERAADIDPADEHTAELLIRMLLAEGYPGEALQRYHRLQRALMATFGIAPGHALSGLVAPLSAQRA